MISKCASTNWPSASMTLASPEIGPANHGDTTRIVEMLSVFLHVSAYKDFLSYEPDRIRGIVDRLISGPDSAVFVARRNSRLVGVIGVWVHEHPLSGDRVAAELFWWVDTNARGKLGLRLLNAAEAWAKEREATAMQMIAPTERVGRVYRRRRYAPLETIYQRAL